MMADQLTDEALEIAYTVYSMQLPLEERVRARHILIAPGSNDEADVRDALVEAQDLIRQLNEGADFAELALEFSDDTAARNRVEIWAFSRVVAWLNPSKTPPLPSS